MNNQNDHDTYIIPPNFVDTGTFFGGMFRARNVIEAGILAAVTGVPVFLFLPFGLTARIIVLCLTTLPLVLFALIGIAGESLSSFLVIFLKYMQNRRIVGSGESRETMRAAPAAKRAGGNKRRKNMARKRPGHQRISGRTESRTEAKKPAGKKGSAVCPAGGVRGRKIFPQSLTR